ncbi:DUF6197 family protein [Nonomuraea lactucae]|uniref:DUF6197 family protein n=1 Tax=Nonomuraea lactucae TaxID=2249762 RepID=UPI000DE1D9D4|nr:hypothetical protein [Nonomuraea lactucae]
MSRYNDDTGLWDCGILVIAAASPTGTARTVAAAFAAADETIDELAAALGRKPSNVQPPKDWLMDWNDDEGPTFDDVLATPEASEAVQ